MVDLLQNVERRPLIGKPRGEVDRQGASLLRIIEEIVVGAADQRVIAEAADEGIGAIASDDQIVDSIAGEKIVAGSGDDALYAIEHGEVDIGARRGTRGEIDGQRLG